MFAEDEVVSEYAKQGEDNSITDALVTDRVRVNKTSAYGWNWILLKSNATTGLPAIDHDQS